MTFYQILKRDNSMIWVAWMNMEMLMELLNFPKALTLILQIYSKDFRVDSDKEMVDSKEWVEWEVWEIYTQFLK